MKKLFRKPILFLAILSLALGALLPSAAIASNSDTVVAKTYVDPGAKNADHPSTHTAPTVKDKKGNIVQKTLSDVAVLTLFAVPSGSVDSSGGSSGSSWGTHAFVTVENVSSSDITVGGLSSITPWTTVSIGTWGNKSEHTGVWYDLEEAFIYNDGAYTGRVSHSMYLTQSQLDSVSTYIRNHDSWSIFNNCSSFAVGLWNSVSTDIYTAGTPNTPQNLYYSIQDGQYNTDASVPYNYVVYYANGTGAPIRSTQY